MDRFTNFSSTTTLSSLVCNDFNLFLFFAMSVEWMETNGNQVSHCRIDRKEQTSLRKDFNLSLVSIPGISHLSLHIFHCTNLPTEPIKFISGDMPVVIIL